MTEPELDPKKIKAVWRQNRIPVVVRRAGLGKPLKVRLPYAEDNREWLQDERRSKPEWNADKRCWELPKAWFNDFVDRALVRYSRLYIIQPYRRKEVCASACWDALGHICSCSCMGANHGMGQLKGFYEVNDAFAVQWDMVRVLACRLVVAKPKFSCTVAGPLTGGLGRV